MNEDQKIQLRIVRPREGLYYGLVSSKKVLRVKIQAFASEKQVDHKKFLPLLGKHTTIGILLNGSLVAKTEHIKSIKATYGATINLTNLSDGTHTLQAVVQGTDTISDPRQIIDSDIVSFIIDRNLPSITSILPSNGMKIEDRAFSRVLVEASGGLTGLYLKRCSVVIDKKVYKNPVEHKKGLVFSIPIPPKQGIHKLKLTVVDKGGNKSTRTTKFEIIETAAQAEEQDWRERKGVVEEKLVSDIRFRKLLFTDARDAFAENGIPFTRAASSVLPPPLPEAHADFFASVDSDMASQKWDAMTQRAFQESPSRNEARIAQIREKLGSQGVTTEDGNLTDNAKDLIAEILQDPQGFLGSLGVTPTEAEKPFIFPSYSEVNAKAFADWFSMTLTGKPPEPSESRQSNLQEISSKVANDPDLLFKWLTKPAETYMELYPDAASRDLTFLPDPISDEEASRIINSRSPVTTAPASQITPHNSSDLVVGFSIPILNEMLGLYFTTLQQPRIFPKSFNTEIRTELPSPYASIRCEVRLEQPDNLTVHDATTKLVSLTASASASVTAEDGTTYSYLLSLTPVYSILLKEDKVFLKFDNIGVTVTDQGTGISAPATATAIKGVVESLIRSQYPDGEIYLVDQRPMNINIPFADVAVDIHRIWVHDDTDPGGSGELYFGIGIDGQEYLFGQIDADSGSTIEISRRFMLKKGGDSFPVQIQGIDMDMGVWPDVDDPLGGSMRLNSMSAPGTYTLRGVTPVTSYELVWDVVEFILKVVCWLVMALAWIFNWLFSGLGWHWEVQCLSWVEGVMGWVRRANTVDLHTYTLEYSVVPLDSVAISIMLKEPQIVNNGLYLPFDFSIPEIGEYLAAKTEAAGFVSASDLGIAFSENLINKVVNAWWRYGPIPKRITTSFGSRSTYAHIDFDQPHLNLVPATPDPSHPSIIRSAYIWLHLATAGVAGNNLGPVHISYGLPNRAEGTMFLSQVGRELIFQLDEIWFVGDEPTQSIVNLAINYAYNFTPDKDKKNLIVDLNSTLRAGVQSTNQELHPTMPVQINEAELIMKFSTDITPSIRIEPSKLDFFLEHTQVLNIKNVGNELLIISDFEIDDKDTFFLIEPPTLPLEILPFQGKLIAVQVTPSWTDLHRGTLGISNNDPANPIATVDLIALDKPIIEVTPELLFLTQDFGSQEVIIKNKGHATLYLTNIVISDSFFSSPKVPATADVPFNTEPIAPGQEYRLTISIDVNKLDGNSRSGMLKIYHDDIHKNNPVEVSLSAVYFSLGGGGSQSGGGGGYQ